jgi:protein involved in sex pheromone biosynthesis
MVMKKLLLILPAIVLCVAACKSVSDDSKKQKTEEVQVDTLEQPVTEEEVM